MYSDGGNLEVPVAEGGNQKGKYPPPTTVRLSEEYQEIIERIRRECGRPGLDLSANDAIKIALAEWNINNPPKAAE